MYCAYHVYFFEKPVDLELKIQKIATTNKYCTKEERTDRDMRNMLICVSVKGKRQGVGRQSRGNEKNAITNANKRKKRIDINSLVSNILISSPEMNLQSDHHYS